MHWWRCIFLCGWFPWSTFRIYIWIRCEGQTRSLRTPYCGFWPSLLFSDFFWDCHTLILKRKCSSKIWFKNGFQIVCLHPSTPPQRHLPRPANQQSDCQLSYLSRIRDFRVFMILANVIIYEHLWIFSSLQKHFIFPLPVEIPIFHPPRGAIDDFPFFLEFFIIFANKQWMNKHFAIDEFFSRLNSFLAMNPQKKNIYVFYPHLEFRITNLPSLFFSI